MATTGSTAPWITSSGGHGSAGAPGVAGVAVGARGLRRPCIARSADKVEWAMPGGTPECITTALKRAGYSVASSVAMLAPADMPASTTCARSAGCRRQTWSMA